MGLLDGGIARVMSGALSSIYLDATLHRATITPDGKGGGSTSFEDEPCKAQIDRTTQAQQRAGDFQDTDQRILVLAAGLDPISTDDEISAGGSRWAISSVSQDPAGAYFDLRGRLSGRNG